MGQPLITDENGIRWITLNRPEIRNALYAEDLARITTAITGIGDSVRAIVLTGSGELAFSAGMHIDTFASAAPEDGRAIISGVRDCIGAVRLAPVPTVAMINGYCIGAEFEMALACDLRVAHLGVRVGLPEVKLGIPSVVDAALLYMYVGLSKAKEIILTGDLYPVSEFACQGTVVLAPCGMPVAVGRLRSVVSIGAAARREGSTSHRRFGGHPRPAVAPIVGAAARIARPCLLSWLIVRSASVRLDLSAMCSTGRIAP